MSKKILFLVNHDLVIYNFRLEIIETMLEKGYEVHVSSPYGERIDKLIDLGCKYHAIKMDRHSKSILEGFRLINDYRKLNKKINPDIIFSFTIKPNIYGGLAAQISKTPFVANITGLGTAVENDGLMQKITTVLYKASFRKIQTIFFQNTENQLFFKNKKIAAGKYKLLPGSGVNLDHFQVMDYPPEEKIVFVFISRIMKEKGTDQYLDAAKYITNKYHNVEFHICGFLEDDYKEIINEYEELGIIKYHGMIRDVREILEITHCTIHPTYYPEGMSNVLLESLASGRPIITTNRSGTREIVEDNINGYMIEAKDTEQLINSIENFVKLTYEKKKKMGLNGRKKVEKYFDREQVVNAYLEEIE